MTTKRTKRTKRKILPVMAPGHNMREIAKQMAMLEDHLQHPSKRCRDCINKHFLTIEGLAEECVALCDSVNKRTVSVGERVAKEMRILHHAWASGAAPAVVASKIRAMRKDIMKSYAVLPLHKLPDKERAAVRRITSGKRDGKRMTQKATAARTSHSVARRVGPSRR